LRLGRTQDFSVRRNLRFLLAGVLTLPGAVKCGWGFPTPQAAVTALGATPAPQNASGQSPATSQQNPPPPAQSQEQSAGNAQVQKAPKPSLPALTIPRLTRAPALDDFLSMKPEGETAQQMAKVTGFVQRNPHDGQKISEDTSAYLGYDQKNLYIVFVCFDDPKKVRARMSRREDIYDDDQVEVMLDTFHDRRRAMRFRPRRSGCNGTRSGMKHREKK
jgi:hypothetical protein